MNGNPQPGTSSRNSGSTGTPAPAAPIQQAAALAFDEPAELTERVDRSRVLHAEVAAAVAGELTTRGFKVLATGNKALFSGAAGEQLVAALPAKIAPIEARTALGP